MKWFYQLITEIIENRWTEFLCQIDIIDYSRLWRFITEVRHCFFFWHESDSTAKKTHPRVTQLISKHENEKCGNYYTQVSLQNPLKQKRQNVRHSFNSRFRLKDFFPNIFTVFRYQSIKITWFLTTFIDFDFYPLTTQGPTGPPGCNCTQISSPTLFLRGGRSEKLDAYKLGQYQPSEEDFKPGFKEKISL